MIMRLFTRLSCLWKSAGHMMPAAGCLLCAWRNHWRPFTKIWSLGLPHLRQIIYRLYRPHWSRMVSEKLTSGRISLTFSAGFWINLIQLLFIALVNSSGLSCCWFKNLIIDLETVLKILLCLYMLLMKPLWLIIKDFL